MTGRVTRARRGAALPFVIGALAVGLAGAAAAAAAVRAGGREARGAAAVLQAGAAADGALAAVVAEWPGRWSADLAVGAGEWRDVRSAAGPARVRVVRLDAERWAVEAAATSRARALPGEAPAERRRVVLVRTRPLRLTAPGPAAVTAGGGVEVLPGALVSGVNAVPAGWTDCGPAGADLVAVAAPALVAGSGAVVGAVRADSAAWAGALAPQFGAVAYPAVRARVERDEGAVATAPRVGGLGGGAFAGDVVEPCAVDGTSWGEPRRGAGAVAECAGAWPVVRLRGPVARLVGPARFQGTLLVDGDLEVDGLVEGAGTVVVRGAVRAAGSFVLDGALVAGGAVRLGAGSRVRASTCAGSRAAAYAARASPLARRSWAEVSR